MEQVLYKYELNLTTWVYLSSLLTIAIYFKFSRLWSIRNLDLMLLIALAPGLLLIDYSLKHGPGFEYWGYVWLFVTGAFVLVRLLIDPRMVRRPLLEPNMSTGGLTFIAASLLVFLMVNVLTKELKADDLDGPRKFDQMMGADVADADKADLAFHGPGYPWLHAIPGITTKTLFPKDPAVPEDVGQYMLLAAAARTMAILSHLAIVSGMIMIGIWHFDNVRTGISAATLYLLLPYTAQMTGRVDHVLPAALLVWAVAAYRSPLVSGMLLGLAAGASYYPAFLLPLWVGFYWQRGLGRFSIGFISMLALMVISLIFTSTSLELFWSHTRMMFGLGPRGAPGIKGFWSFNPSWEPYMISVLAAFLAMCGGFALWPAPKNLGTLLSCSAAVMVGTQFWHVQGGGLYIAWYLPLLLLTIFRPNLEDRVALATLGESWFTRRRALQRRGPPRGSLAAILPWAPRNPSRG